MSLEIYTESTLNTRGNWSPPPPVVEPTPTGPLMSDPVDPETMTYFMGFPKSIRDWWIRVWGGQSGDMYYSEESGWTQSDEPAQEVHHIIPESELRSQGRNPDRTPAVPLSQQEHSGTGKTIGGRLLGWGEKGHSMHPDMGEAREQYRAGDKDAFAKAAKQHGKKAKRGEKIVNTDEQLDGWLLDQANEKAARYALAHPEDPKPDVHHRKEEEPEHWTDIYYGFRGYDEDIL